MSETLIHRGPDAEGTFVKGGVGLASRRLAIIDLAGGDQPISNEDGSCTVVQNGEIYNYAELNRSLERAGHTLRTRSDTETIVHAYEEWDLGFAERLRGMFAIAIWDARRKRLVLARDRFGIKPLYYRDVDGELSFASELDALAEGRPRPRRARGVPRVQHRPHPALDLPRDPQAPARARADLGGREGRPRALRAARAAAGAGRRRGRAARGVPGAAARLGACASRLRRPRRRAALGRGRLGDARGARLRGELGAGAHVLDRVRGAVVRRARRRPRGLGALRHAPSRARAATRRGAAPPRAGRRVRRAVRGLLGAADLPRLAARGRGREGGALGRGRRRALRRLLHLRGGSARRAVRARGDARRAGDRAAAVLVAARELRLPREAVRSRRAPAAARAARGVEDDLLGRRARRADRPPPRLGPALARARALRRDRRATSC